ncbi:MAG: hypothetical protein INR66_23165 [Gordonia polyisoprenivorans]|nr:hypothetical protein [Gordonia polyisoprenivorans]
MSIDTAFTLDTAARHSTAIPIPATTTDREPVTNEDWIDATTRSEFFRKIHDHCINKQALLADQSFNGPFDFDRACTIYANSALTDRATLLNTIQQDPTLIDLPNLPPTTFGSVWNDYVDALQDMAGMAADAGNAVAHVAIGGCLEGGSVGACIFDVASMAFTPIKGVKAVKAGVEIAEDGAEAIKVGERAATSANKVDEAAVANPAARRPSHPAHPDATPGRGRSALEVARATAKRIADGHAYQKHVIERGEFPGVSSRAEFSELVESVMKNGSVKTLPRGRMAYWLDGTVVIRNPRAQDLGTAFRPTEGRRYFDELDQ